jgi:hypothetical protein
MRRSIRVKAPASTSVPSLRKIIIQS